MQKHRLWGRIIRNHRIDKSETVDIENGDIESAKDRLDLARLGMTSPLNYATPEMIDAKRDELRNL